jgi:hypothetical protein
MAAAPRSRARRKATKVPEGARPEEYWVVMGEVPSLSLLVLLQVYAGIGESGRGGI